MSAKEPKKPLKKKTNGYEMAEPINKGEILIDIKKNKWILGTSIGIGGFGEIYEAAVYTGKPPKEYPAVIKIEPHVNGPLFVEMHFYIRNVNIDDIEAWKKKKKLPSLGMPKFLGSGSHEYNGTKYRFLVVERYGTDLWKLFNSNGHSFPEHTVYNIALQVIDVLEYIHNKNYIHGDIKGGNLLLDLKSPKQVYLVDFGLACRYTTKDEFKPDPKKAHDGTPEYTSRDAHKGVSTMRGDLEILGYNIIHWLCGSLPWESDVKNPSKIHKKKEDAFNNLSMFLNTCFKDTVPDTVIQYMKLVNATKFQETPNYDKFKDILIKGLHRLNKEPYGKLEFKEKSKDSIKKSKTNIEVKKKSLRVDLVRLPDEMNNTSDLDESVNTLVDAKFSTGSAAINHLLDNVDFDSESEYDVQIKKRRKKTKEVASSVRKLRKPKIKSVSEDDSDSTPKKDRERAKAIAINTKITPRKRTAKTRIRYVNDSDDDMFDN